jgi:O-antigen/teichoic acid export membrane protein
MKEPKTLAGKAGVLTVANALGVVANLATPFVLVRILSKEDYGLLGMIFFLIMSVHSLIGLNVSNSAAFFIPRGEMEPKRVLGSIQTFNVVIGVVILVWMLLAPGPILWLFKAEDVSNQIVFAGLTLLVWNCSRAMSLVPIAMGRSAVSAVYIAVTESLKNVFVLCRDCCLGRWRRCCGFFLHGVLRECWS